MTEEGDGRQLKKTAEEGDRSCIGRRWRKRQWKRWWKMAVEGSSGRRQQNMLQKEVTEEDGRRRWKNMQQNRQLKKAAK